jgi:hypothetical protein
MEYSDQSINVKVFDKEDNQVYEIDCPSLALMSVFLLFFCPTTEHKMKMTWPNGHCITTILSNPNCWSYFNSNSL